MVQYNSDLERCTNSSSLQVHPEIKLLLNLKISRFLAQIRLLNNINCKLYIDANINKFNDQIFCQRCLKNNSLLHMLIEYGNFINERENISLPLTL